MHLKSPHICLLNVTSREITGQSALSQILWMKQLQSSEYKYFFRVDICIMYKFYLPVLANPGISELFLKAINCKVGVTFVLEEALAFIPQSNWVRIKCFRLWWKELERYFLRFYGSNINLWVFRILKEGIWSILIEVWGSKIKNSIKSKWCLPAIACSQHFQSNLQQSGNCL